LGSAAVEGVSQTSAANRVVQALGTGKIDTSFLPDSVLGQLEYQGTWAAATNSPAIPPASTANKGDYRVASNSVAAGHGYANVPNIAFDTGDWIVSNGTAWEKVDNTDAVSTVFGRLGPIVAANGDYNAGQITNTPAGNIAAVTVQAALNELDAEKQPLDADLTAIAALSTNGLVERTGGGTAAIRTIGTAAAGDVPDRAAADLRYAALVHATRHQAGGADPIKLDDLATPDDNTDLNVSTSAHGLHPKFPNNNQQFLDGAGVYRAVILHGTGAAPSPAGLADGTIYVQYTP